MSTTEPTNELSALSEDKEFFIRALRASIEEDNSKLALGLLDLLNTAELELELVSDDEPDMDNRMGDTYDCIYATIGRKLVIEDFTIADWTITARGWYQDSRSNPNYTIGWNVDEDDSGGDGISNHSTLYYVLRHLTLLDQAKELPSIEEPAAAEHCAESEATHAVMVRNPYTQGMEDFDTRSFHASEEEARKALDESYRAFRSQNSDNAYGPVWAIATRDEDGKWVPIEEDEK